MSSLLEIALYKYMRLLQQKRKEQEQAARESQAKSREKKDSETTAEAPPELSHFIHKWWEKYFKAETPPNDSVSTSTSQQQTPTSSSSSVSVGRKLRGLVSPTPLKATAATAIMLVVLTFLESRTEIRGTWLMQHMFMGALVGIGTNWLAIKMLFRPHKKWLFLQGVIPREREAIIDSIANGVATQLLDKATVSKAIRDSDIVSKKVLQFIEKLREIVSDKELQGDINQIISGYVRAFVSNKEFRERLINTIANMARLLPDKLNWVPEFIKDWLGRKASDLVKRNRQRILKATDDYLGATIEKIAAKVVKWLQKAPETFNKSRSEVEEWLTDRIIEAAQEFDVKSIIVKKMREFDLMRIERLILDATERQLAYIQYYGLLIGAIVAPTVLLIGWMFSFFS